MLRVFRTQSQYSYYPQRFHLGLCEKKYLNRNFTNSFLASVIFLEKGSLNKSWSSRLFSLTGLNSNSPTSIPVILIWESYPILPHHHILSLSRLSFLNATVHARMHATYRRCFLKPSRILSIFSNP